MFEGCYCVVTPIPQQRHLLAQSDVLGLFIVEKLLVGILHMLEFGELLLKFRRTKLLVFNPPV